MIIQGRSYERKGLYYTIRSAAVEDAAELSSLRLQIDGETEYLDRVPGEAYLDGLSFAQLIRSDTAGERNLFLVAETNNRLVGFSRCQGTSLSRLAHQVEFGIAILKEYWGFGIGGNLLQESIRWADHNGIEKIRLSVLTTNTQAIELYTRFGFQAEGLLRKDKLLSDGRYYDTVLMGRFRNNQ